MATHGRLSNDFLPLQTFDKLNLCIRHLKTKLVLLAQLLLGFFYIAVSCIISKVVTVHCYLTASLPLGVLVSGDVACNK
jgi:hypothetical protein